MVALAYPFGPAVNGSLASGWRDWCGALHLHPFLILASFPHSPARRTYGFSEKIAVGFALLAILVLDFGVRQLYKKVRKSPVRSVSEHREANPFYHHGLRSNASVMDTFGDRVYPFFSNSMGMRDASSRQISARKTGPRILLIGDSFTEGVGLPWDKTFAGILASRFSEKGIEVLNSGVNSYCPILFKGRLQYLLAHKHLEVDQVVVFVDISDIMQELTFRKNNYGFIESQPLFPEIVADVSRYNQTETWLRQNIEDHFVILGAIVRNLRLWYRNHGSSSAIRQQDEIPTWAFEWPDYQGPYDNLIQLGLESAKNHMTQIASFLKQRRIKLTVVIYPWPQQIRAASRPSRAEKEWETWAKENSVQLINLFPLFVNSSPPEEIISRYYLKNDSHWNDEGHRLVAETLLQAQGGIILPQKTKKDSKT